MLASALVLAFTLPAAALDVENTIGGYWRTRAFIQQRFSGEDAIEGQDLQRIDTRTRIYLYSKFSDNFRLINKFEMDAQWGDDGYGDIGADGVAVEVKNSYADFTLNSFNVKLGVQGWALARGFLFDDDSAAAVVTYKSDMFTLPLIYSRVDDNPNIGQNEEDFEVHYFAASPTFKVSDAISLNPFIFWTFSDDAVNFNAAWNDLSLYYIGASADIKMDPYTFWFTGIFNGGEVDLVAGGTADRSAFLVAGGAKTNFGPVGVHAEAFFATGDDDLTDDDAEAFGVPKGDSYYWAEIMGYGTFDNQVSNGSPANNLTNILAGNIGFTYNLTDAWKFKGDLWAAALPEEQANGDDFLGTEIDIKATYKVMDGLNLDLIGAYLFAGDATEQGTSAADPWELGARLSLSF